MQVSILLSPLNPNFSAQQNSFCVLLNAISTSNHARHLPSLSHAAHTSQPTQHSAADHDAIHLLTATTNTLDHGSSGAADDHCNYCLLHHQLAMTEPLKLAPLTTQYAQHAIITLPAYQTPAFIKAYFHLPQNHAPPHLV